MTIGERLKKLRKALDLTQQEFSDKLKVSRSNIATYEVGKNNPADAVINLICLEFNVSETWLRTGEGEMFLPSPNGVLDELAQKYGLSTRGKVIVEKFLDLNPDVQEAVAVYIEEVAAAFSDAGTSAPVPDGLTFYRRQSMRLQNRRTQSLKPRLRHTANAAFKKRDRDYRPLLRKGAARFSLLVRRRNPSNGKK